MICMLYDIPDTDIRINVEYNGWYLSKLVADMYENVSPAESGYTNHPSTDPIEKLENIAVSVRDGAVACVNTYRIATGDGYTVDGLDWLMSEDAERALVKLLKRGVDVYIQNRFTKELTDA